MSAKQSTRTTDIDPPTVVRLPDQDSTEDLLWSRVFKGLLVGAVVAGLLAFLLIAAIQPDESWMAKIGLALFIAFWSGPFIGLSGAVGYHELKKGHAAAPDRSARFRIRNETINLQV